MISGCSTNEYPNCHCISLVIRQIFRLWLASSVTVAILDCHNTLQNDNETNMSLMWERNLSSLSASGPHSSIKIFSPGISILIIHLYHHHFNRGSNPDKKASFIKALRLRQNGRHFPDNIFKWIFLNENVWISLKISVKFVPKVQINNIPALVEIMAWRRSGDKPLSQPMVVSLPTHICVTPPQWVKAPRSCHNNNIWDRQRQ